MSYPCRGISRRLSPKVRWIDREPVARTSGDLYYRCDMPSGKAQWARVIGGSMRRNGWWMNHLVMFSGAQEVTRV